MAKKTSKKQYTTVGQLARIDYLLSDNYVAPKLSIVTGEQKSQKTGKAVKKGNEQAVDLERHRLMSNDDIKYFYQKESNVIHDKTCLTARQIPMDQLCTSKEYLPEMIQCPECMQKAYIRAGGKASELNEYMKFFIGAGVDDDIMRRIFIEDKAETAFVGNALTLKIGEDTWMLRLVDTGKHWVELLHNKFSVREKKRIIEPGFYTVFQKVNILEALLFMESYLWERSRRGFSWKLLKQRLLISLGLWCESVRKKLKVLRNNFALQKTRHVYYIDGDNTPCERMRGMELLTEKDLVKIYCAKTGNYYTYQRRADIRDRYVCNVKFIPVEPGNNAADFAIGLDAYDTLLHNPKTRVYLISGDKHFDVITTRIKALLGQQAHVLRAECIRDVRR